MAFAAVERWLEGEIGLDPGAIGSDEIARVARTRMRELGLNAVPVYLARIESDPVERDELIEGVLVPETWFFREPGALTVLRERVDAHGARGRPSPFRILSIPCATGEEPYSVAMTLVEAGAPSGTFQLDGLDLSQRSLARAREASYDPRALRHVSARLRDRFFEAVEGRFHLRNEVARLVNFNRANLVDADLLRGHPVYDAILCRNALMYFRGPTQARVLQRLHECLADTGVLFTGHAEGLRVVRPLFVSAGTAHPFAYGKADARAARVELTGPVTHAHPAKARDLPRGRTSTETRTPVSSVPGPSRVRVGGTPTAAGHPLGGDPERDPESDASALSEIARLADGGHLEAARAQCLEFLAKRPTSAEAYYLRGVIALAAGQCPQGEEALRRSIYLDPRHAAALHLLARERARQGDRREANQLRRRAALARGDGLGPMRT